MSTGKAVAGSAAPNAVTKAPALSATSTIVGATTPTTAGGLSVASQAATAPRGTQSSLFRQDDEATLNELLMGVVDKDRISELLALWNKDVSQVGSDEWLQWLDSVTSLGCFVVDDMKGIPKQASATNADTAGAVFPIPAAFETSSGKSHVQAVSDHLSLSRRASIRLTLSALVQFDSYDRLQALLGTQELFLTVVGYHARQRLARFRAVTECLRMEQDDQFASLMKELLDPYDQDCSRRGLFRRLLSCACAPIPSPTRNQVLPLQHLNGKRSHNQFIQECFNVRQNDAAERQEALEALLVLVYQRTKVSRRDLAVTLVAFQSGYEFFTLYEGPTKADMCRLTGLICAASLGLWAVDLDNKDWVEQHSLLMINLGENRGEQLKVLLTVFSQLSNQVIERRSRYLSSLVASKATETVVDAPEGLALLGFGLLLHLSGIPDFEEAAKECTQVASDNCGAFAYLQHTLDTLLVNSKKPSINFEDQPRFDWQFSDGTPQLAVEEEVMMKQAFDAQQVACASIGLEFVSSTVAAFPTSILGAVDNLAMLSNLVAAIYNNIDLFCQPFWRDFENYSSANTARVTNKPMCQLLDATYRFAVEVEGTEETCLNGLAPLLRMISSMCSDFGMLSNVLQSMPEPLLRKSLELCAPTKFLSNASVYRNVVKNVLESVQRMLKVGEVSYLRNKLGESGPKILFRILMSHKDEAIISLVLSILSEFADEEHWMLRTWKLVGSDGVSQYLTESTIHSSTAFLSTMTKQLDAIVFRHHENAVPFLEGLVTSLIRACDILAPIVTKQNAFQLASGILGSLQSCVRSLRQIVSLHPDENIRSTSRHIRDTLTQTLATSTSLGNALAYFACAPVSLQLALALEADVYESNLQRMASGEYAVDDSNNKYGAWRNVVRESSEMSKRSRTISNLHQKFMQRFREDSMPLKMEELVARGWIAVGDENLILQASALSLQVLKLWFCLVEDMLEERKLKLEARSSDAVKCLQTFSPFRLIASLAITPPVLHENSEVLAVWPSDEISHIDLLSKLFAVEYTGSFRAGDVLQMTAVHAAVCGGNVLSLERAFADDGMVYSCITSLLQREDGDRNCFAEKMVAIRLLAAWGTVPQNLLAVVTCNKAAVLNALAENLKTLFKKMKREGNSFASKMSVDEKLTCALRIAADSAVLIQHTHQACRTEGSLPLLAEAFDAVIDKSFFEGIVAMKTEFCKKQSFSSMGAMRAFQHGTIDKLLSAAFWILSMELAIVVKGGKSDVQEFVKVDETLIPQTILDMEMSQLVETEKSISGSKKMRLPSIQNLLCLFSAQPGVSDWFVATADLSLMNDAFSKVGDEEIDWSGDVVTLNAEYHLLLSQIKVASGWAAYSQVKMILYKKCDVTWLMKTIDHVFKTLIFFAKELPTFQVHQVEMITHVKEMLNVILQSVSVLRLNSVTPPRDIVAILTKLVDLIRASGNAFKKSCRNDPSVVHSIDEKLLCATDLLLEWLKEQSVAEALQAEVDRCAVELVGNISEGITFSKEALRTTKMDEGTLRYIRISLAVFTTILCRERQGNAYKEEIRATFEQHHTLESIALLGIAASNLGSRQSVAVDTVRSIIAFQTLLVQTSSAYLLSLPRCELSQFLIYNPMLAEAASRWKDAKMNDYRGYLPSKQKSAVRNGLSVTLESANTLFLTGKEDLSHVLWTESLGLLLMLMQLKPTEAGLRKFLLKVSTDFVEKHMSTLQQCLNTCNCGKIPASGSSPVLTFKVVSEASLILALIAELAKEATKTVFDVRCAEVCKHFVGSTRFLVGSLVKFLGASGSARELFNLVAAIESLTNQDDDDFRLGPTAHIDLHPSFSGGVPSARHEAIGSSHLARRCYAIVSENKDQASANTGPMMSRTNQVSQGSLEKEYQVVISSDFHQKMENVVAKCLTNALSVLWHTRPSSSCFTMLTPQEAKAFDCVNLVQTGMIIAVRPEAAKIDLRVDDDDDPIRFASVKDKDTIRREWKVVFLQSFDEDEDDEEYIISMEQFAGFEDTVQKKPSLDYVSATGSSKELEKAPNVASVAHLITILRWCYQHDRNGKGAHLTSRRGLAQAAATLLGDELALHEEVKTDSGPGKGGITAAINMQSQQLFDDKVPSTPDEDDLTREVRKNRVASLKALLGEELWAAVLQQLKHRLHAAQLDRNKREEKRRASLRRGFTRSPSF